MKSVEELFNEVLSVHSESNFLTNVVLTEIEKLKPLFLTGEEKYLVMYIIFDNTNNHINYSTKGLESVLLKFYSLDEEEYDMDHFEIIIIKDDKVVYDFNSEEDINWNEL